MEINKAQRWIINIEIMVVVMGKQTRYRVANVLGKRNYPCQIPPSFKSSSVSNLRKKSIQTETSTNKNTRHIPLQSPIGGYSGLHKLYSCTG